MITRRRMHSLDECQEFLKAAATEDKMLGKNSEYLEYLHDILEYLWMYSELRK